MSPAADSGKAPILVVDDDRKILNLVRTYLEREGHVVLTAGDGMAALRAFRHANPRLMVLDVMLPELDGLAVLRTVREDSDIPILLLSARGSTADRVYGIKEGADDYLPKPFSLPSSWPGSTPSSDAPMRQGKDVQPGRRLSIGQTW